MTVPVNCKHLRCALNTPCRQTPEMRTEYTFAGKHLECALKIPLQTLVVGGGDCLKSKSTPSED